MWVARLVITEEENRAQVDTLILLSGVVGLLMFVREVRL